MQASGVQYGVAAAEGSQFMVGRGPPHTMFSASTSPSLGEHHQYSSSNSQQQNSRNLQQQQQQQQHLKIQMVVQKVGVGADSAKLLSPLPPLPSVQVQECNNNNSEQQQQNQVEGNSNSGGTAAGGDDDVFGGEVDCERGGSTGNRWPKQETLALLKIRSEMDANFRDANLKGPLWEHVSRRLEELGYHRDPKKCKEKFENLHKYYKRTKEGRTGRQDGKAYRFFTQLEALYANHNSNKSNEPINNNSNTTAMISNGDTDRIQGHEHVVNARRDDDNSNNNMGGNHIGPTLASAGNTEANFSEGISFSSDSSEEDYDEPRDNHIRKRKRSSTKKMMGFFENLMKQVIEKQERMQQKFLEAIEKREQDRMIREEAWRRQEMVRLNRDQELRSQERSLAASRDLALVSFLQKITGQTLQLDSQLMQPHQIHEQEQEQEQELHDQYKDLSCVDPNSKRWPKPEVHALIRIRSGMSNRFQETGPKGPLWEEISAEMASLGYNRSAKRCKEKWENINKYYKKAKESNKKRPENAKTCPYFHQLDTLYRRGMLSNANKAIEDIQTDQDHQEELLEQASGSNREESTQGLQGADEDGDGDGSAEILAIMPLPDSDTALPHTPTSNGSTLPTFFSNPDNSSADNGSLTKELKQQGLMKEIMDQMQPTRQQHHVDQSGVEGNICGHKMEVMHSILNNLQDREKQKQTEHLHTSTARDTSFMEMVQKLTADPPDFNLSASS